MWLALVISDRWILTPKIILESNIKMNIKNLETISYLRPFGLNPIIAIIVFIVDWLIFVGEIVIPWPLIDLIIFWIPSGIIVTIGVTIGQKKLFGDSSAMAFSKGILLGILTAIPTPIFSFVSIVGLSFSYLPKKQTLPINSSISKIDENHISSSSNSNN
ncbi:MAG: hypothetical protein RR808_04785 [Akkermansia sp.]